MYKISISDKYGDIINVFTLGFEQEYLLESADEQLALGRKIGEMIRWHEDRMISWHEDRIIKGHKNNIFNRNRYYHSDLCFYITSLSIGLVLLWQSYSLGILENVRDYLILRYLGLLALYSFIGVLISAGVQPCTDIVLDGFRKGNHMNPPRANISAMSTVLVICIFYFIFKLFGLLP